MNIHIVDINLAGSPHFWRLNDQDLWTDTFVVYTA